MERGGQQNADVLSALRELQQHPAFSDFTIQLKHGAVRVNKLLLAAVSPVFREMALQKPRDSFVRLDMSHLSHEAWDCITQFYFNNEACLSLEIVAEVLEVSEWYGLDRLKNYCCEFLTSCCAFENCLQVMRIAKLFGLEGPVQTARQIFSFRFQAGCSLDDFLCLEKTELLELLEKEELVTTEDDFCEAVLAWMEAKDADVDTCIELFQHVRLHKVSDDFLSCSILYHRVSTRTPAIQVKIQNEFATRAVHFGRKRSRGVPQKRSVQEVDETLVVVGGTSQNQLHMHHWSHSERKWISFPNPDREVGLYSASAACEGTLVITDGVKGPGTETHLFDLTSRTWSAGPALLEGRTRHGMAAIRDRVYVVGGYLYWNSSNSVEEFSLTTRLWTHIGKLTVAANECGVTAIGDTILVAGGDTDESQSLIQTFNVETRTAAVLNVQLPRPMRHVRAARHGETAFFVGSEGDLVQIAEVEGEFQMTSHVQLEGFGKKTWFGLQVTDHCVRVIGGKQSQSIVCWNHQGQKTENDDVGDLPEKLCVLGVHEVDHSLP